MAEPLDCAPVGEDRGGGPYRRDVLELRAEETGGGDSDGMVAPSVKKLGRTWLGLGQSQRAR